MSGIRVRRALEAPHVVRLLCRALDRERFLSELLPAPLRRAPHVHHVAADRAGAALPPLPRAGPVVPVAPRLRDPPPAAPRILRHGTRSTLAVLLPRCVPDDAPHEAALRRVRL